MKTRFNHTAKAIATCACLLATSVLVHAGGPDFSGQEVTATDLRLEDIVPDIKFDDITTGGGNHEFEIELFQNVLSCFTPSGESFFHCHKSDGSMGFGNSKTAPDSAFHFRPTGFGGDAAILCDNSTQGSTIPRNMFELFNNGAPRFVLQDGSLSGINKYTFAMNPAGNFTMTRAGVAGAEFIIYRDGNIEMGPGTTTSLRVTGSGIQALSYQTLSDENAKRDIEEVKTDEMLDKIKQLPVSTWRFKGEDDTLHIGPMAQDFHQTFGDGSKKNNTTINLADMAGVALAGVKSLDQKIDERDQKIEALEARLVRLEALLSEK